MFNSQNLTDEIFSLYSEYANDPRPNKINGGIGIYLDNLGKPFIIPIVKKVVSSLSFSNYNYLPINGDPTFLEESSRLVLGNNLYKAQKKTLIKQGVVGGTNGIFAWASLIKLIDNKPTIIISNPTWENHKKIFNYLGFKIIEYQHLDTQNKFNFRSFENTIKKYPKAYLLFHGGQTHNPTGTNPNRTEWRALAKLIKKTNNYVCFDSAYIGLGNNVEDDCFPIRYFIENNINTSIVISYSKNMSLYQHRTGVLIMTSNNKENRDILESKIKYIFRIVNSSPPAFGELIARNILQNNVLKKEWLKTVSEMANSLQKRRQLFNKYTNSQFAWVVNQKGLFSLLNLDQKKIKILKKKCGIYLLSNSRINFGGISISQIPYVAKSIISIL